MLPISHLQLVKLTDGAFTVTLIVARFARHRHRRLLAEMVTVARPVA